MKFKILVSAMILCALLAVPASAQQDPLDLGEADTAFFVISEPTVGAVDQLVTAELYFWNDAQNMGNVSSGWGWDNPNFVMESAVWSPEAISAFNMLRLSYYQNDLDATNANQLFQATGMRIMGDGLVASTTAQLVVTYTFRVSSWSEIDQFCIDVAEFIPLAFVDLSNNEYVPIFKGPLCVGNVSTGVLVVSPPTLEFFCVAAEANPSAQIVSVTEAGGQNIAFDLATDAGWINLGSTSGTTPQDISVGIDNTGLGAGDYLDSIMVTSGDATNTAWVYVNLHLYPSNQPPVLNPIGNQSVQEGELLQFTVSATDPESDSIILSVAALPSGAVFSDYLNGTGLFSWTPVSSQIGSHQVIFYATAGGATDSESVIISVVDSHQDPLDLGVADSILMEIVQPDDWGTDSTFAVELYAYNDVQNVTNMSSGFSWDNANVQMDSAVWSPEALDAFNLFRFTFYKNSLDSTNANRLFQATGMRLSSNGLAASLERKLLATYYFHIEGWTPGAALCISLDNFNYLLFVELSNNEYTPIWPGSECACLQCEPIQAAFSASPLSGAPPLTVSFTDESTGDITGWDWDFGDGNSSTVQNPTHTYQSVNSYTVSLTVTGPGGSSTATLVNYINVTSGCRSTMCLQGEVISGAIDRMCVVIGVEAEAETQDMPPEPPEYTCYLQDWGPDGSGPYGVDMRQTGSDRYEWILDIDPHGNVPPLFTQRCATLNWNPGEFCPEGYYWLEDRGPDGTGNAVVVSDMRSVTEYEICGLGQSHYFAVVWSEQVCLQQTFVTGWQMVSLPVIPEDPSVEALFPGYLAAWRFEPGSGYVLATEFEPCRGYWLKLGSDVTMTVCGQPVTDCSRALSSGWHMVGGPNCITTPQTDPPDHLSALWGFEPGNGYVLPDYLRPWQGYWAKLDAPADILLDCTSEPVGPVPGDRDVFVAKSEASEYFVLSALTEGSEGLNRSEVILGTDSLTQRYPSAPLPPDYSVYLELYTSDGDGPFYRDIRLVSDEETSWLVAIRSSGVGSVHLGWDPGFLSGPYQLLLGDDLETGRALVEDMRDVSQCDLPVFSEVTYVTVTRGVLKPNGSGESLPGTYVLEQCYPNPFNPVTEIRFGLPTSGQTVLEIFNVLGQRVRVLVDKPMPEGWHAVSWDGTDDQGRSLSTGVYLYRLTANGFADSRKMLLLK